MCFSVSEFQMAELTPLAAAQAEVEEVSGILKDNMGKVLILLKLNGREWMEMNRVSKEIGDSVPHYNH